MVMPAPSRISWRAAVMRAARVRSFWRTRWDTAGPGGPPLASIWPARGMGHEAAAGWREARTAPARHMRGWKRAPPAKGAAMPDEPPFDAASLVASAETAAGF